MTIHGFGTPIKFSEANAEYFGNNNYRLISAFYNQNGMPTSGLITFSNFFGKTNRASFTLTLSGSGEPDAVYTGKQNFTMTAINGPYDDWNGYTGYGWRYVGSITNWSITSAENVSITVYYSQALINPIGGGTPYGSPSPTYTWVLAPNSSGAFTSKDAGYGGSAGMWMIMAFSVNYTTNPV